jgi:hypothetical protein
MERQHGLLTEGADLVDAGPMARSSRDRPEKFLVLILQRLTMLLRRSFRPACIFPKARAVSGPLLLVHRLAYNGDVAAGQLVVFQGASEVPVSELIRVERATRKNSQLAAPQHQYDRLN